MYTSNYRILFDCPVRSPFRPLGLQNNTSYDFTIRHGNEIACVEKFVGI